MVQSIFCLIVRLVVHVITTPIINIGITKIIQYGLITDTPNAKIMIAIPSLSLI